MPRPDPASATMLLHAIADEYPAELRAGQHADVPRIAFHLRLVLDGLDEGAAVCDVGGGVGLFSAGAAALGFRAILVDDFDDAVNRRHGEALLAPHRRRGVEVIRRDVIADGLDLPEASLDAVCTFDSLEHWHHSPRAMLHRCVTSLRPGGRLVIGAPNAVNLRKRLTVPFGIGQWSGFDEWYGEPTFRGHVREPDVSDLRRIGRDLGLDGCHILGRNWLGYRSRFAAARRLVPLVDLALRLRPSLCSDLYLCGRRPG